MSLLKRVERAQQAAAERAAAEAQAADDPSPLTGSQPVAVMAIGAPPPPPVTPPPPPVAIPDHAGRASMAAGAHVPTREEMFRDIRIRLQAEVVNAFDTLLDDQATDVRTKIEGIVDRTIAAKGFAVTRLEHERLVEELTNDVTGFGPLEPLLSDESITEVMVNGPNHIYIERGGKIQKVDTVFLNDEHVLRIIDRIITPMGRRIDETSPRVDARLPDGSRVNAIVEPLSLVGPVITVRKFSKRPYTVEDLVRVRDRDERDVRLHEGLHRGAAEPVRLRRDGLRQDDDAQRPVVVHPERRAHRDDRGRRRAPAPPGPRHHPRVAAAQPRGRGRDHDPPPAPQRDAHAAGPGDRRRVPFRRGPGHAPGDDDRPRRLALDGPREQLEGHAPPARDDGPDDRLRAAAAGDPRADRLGRRPDRPHRPAQGRHPEGRQHHRGLRDRGRRDPDAGHLRVRADRRERGREDRSASSGRPGSARRSCRSSRRRASTCRPASSASRPRTRTIRRRR